MSDWICAICRGWRLEADKINATDFVLLAGFDPVVGVAVQLGVVFEVQLGADVAAVRVDRARAEMQLFGDLLICQTAACQFEDFQLAVGQARNRVVRRRFAGGRVVDQVRHGVRAEIDFATDHLTQRINHFADRFVLGNVTHRPGPQGAFGKQCLVVHR